MTGEFYSPERRIGDLHGSQDFLKVVKVIWDRATSVFSLDRTRSKSPYLRQESLASIVVHFLVVPRGRNPRGAQCQWEDRRPDPPGPDPGGDEDGDLEEGTGEVSGWVRPGL